MDVSTRLQQLEGQVQDLSQAFNASLSRIQELEETVTKSQTRIETLEQKEEKIKTLNLQVLDLKRKLKGQNKQIQIANAKCGKLEKLQVILSSMLLPEKQLRRRDTVLNEPKTKDDDTGDTTRDVERPIINAGSEATGARNNATDSFQDIVTKSVFHVQTDQSQSLEYNSTKMVEGYHTVHQNSPHFDKTTGLFTAPTDGVYLFYLTVTQSGQGKVGAAIGQTDGVPFFLAVPHVRSGWFYTMSDARCGCIVLLLTRNQKVGAYVKLIRGDATLKSFAFGGCLLSSSS